MAKNTGMHAGRGFGRSNMFLGSENLGFMCSSNQNPAHEQMVTKIHKQYTNVFISSCTSTKQQCFNLNQTIMDESSKIKSNNQTLNQCIFLNIQPFFTIQSSLNSAWQDL